jgi:hypothetical protein
MKLIRQARMKIDRQINRIIETYMSAISSGQETIDSILEKYPQYARELRPRLEAVFWLANARKHLGPRDGFISSSRMYIEGQFETVQPHGFWHRIYRQHTPQRWVFNFAAPVILVLLLALVINNLILTARLSIPGDPLYTTKLLIEDIQLALTFNPVDKADLYIQLSRERTTEFVDLVLKGDYEILPTAATRLETGIIASLHSIYDMTDHDLAVDQSMTDKLRETLSSEISILNILKDSSPPTAIPGIELAIQAVQSGLLSLQ